MSFAQLRLVANRPRQEMTRLVVFDVVRPLLAFNMFHRSIPSKPCQAEYDQLSFVAGALAGTGRSGGTPPVLALLGFRMFQSF